MRTPSLNAAKQNHACLLVASGYSLRDAAQSLGCSERTLRRERNRNEHFRNELRDARLVHFERQRWFRDELGLLSPVSQLADGAARMPREADSISGKADSRSPKADTMRPEADTLKSFVFRTFAAAMRKSQPPRQSEEAA